MKTAKYKTEWNLGLLYKNEKDPQIEKDIHHFESICATFEKKYKGKDFTSTSKKLHTALQDHTALEDNTLAKPWWYFALRNEKNSDDAIAGSRASKMEDRMTHAQNRVTFFRLTLGQIPLKLQKQYLKDPILADYRYALERSFLQAQYNLSEKEEQLAGLLGQTSYTMWTNGQQRAINQKTVSFEGKEIPLSKAKEILNDLPKEKRHELYKKIVTTYKDNSVFAESELNAIVNYKKVMDQRRGFKKSYSSRMLSDEVDEKTIEDLISIVSKYFPLSKKFYSLHAKLLGEKTVTHADRMATIGKVEKNFNFDETVSIVKNSFAKVDPKYAAIVQNFVDNGQIDVYPKKGKRGGAFCWGMGMLPTFVLLNQVDTLRSVDTFAHEMGHAIHGELERKIPTQYKGHTTATAEVASTFFEQLVANEVSQKLTEEEQIIVLHGRILNDVISIFGQIAGFNYEIELHEKIRAKGQISREEIAALLKKNYQSFYGPAIALTDDDGYNFVGWNHTRYFFYIYSYAHGVLISRALYEKWKADPAYAVKIEQFLSSGRSGTTKDIFKSIGIKIDKSFFEAGLKGIEADINKLEKLAKKFKKI
jgi:oligoendopeptidase F